MKTYMNIRECIDACTATKRFSISHPTTEKKHFTHDCYLIYYLMVGEEVFQINKKETVLCPGDILFLNPQQEWEIKESPTEWTDCIIIAVCPKYLQSLSTEQTDLSTVFKPQNSDMSKIHLSQRSQLQFRNLCHSISASGGFGHEILENCLLSELLILLNYEYIKQNTKEGTVGFAAKRIYEQESTLLLDLLAYINLNYTTNTDLSLDGLSLKFNVSKSYICRIFKAYTGTTVQKYIMERKISFAKAELEKGKRPNEICDALGFINYSSFYKAFKLYTSFSPQEYANAQYRK